MFVGPAADSVHDPAGAVPPCVLLTLFTSVNVAVGAAVNVFVIVHVALSPTASAIEFRLTAAPPFFAQLYDVPFV